MSNRKLPDTSLAAYKQAEPMISPHHQKIISALSVLGKAIYEKIAAHLEMDRHQIGRRLSELEGKGIVYKPGTKAPTKTGRMAYEYCLTEDGQQLKVDEGNVYKQGTKTSTDFSKEIIKATKKIKQPVHNPLFD